MVNLSVVLIIHHVQVSMIMFMIMFHTMEVHTFQLRLFVQGLLRWIISQHALRSNPVMLH